MRNLKYGDRQWLKLLFLACLWSVAVWLIQENQGIANSRHLMFVVSLSHAPALFVFILRPILKKIFAARMEFQRGFGPYLLGILILTLSTLPVLIRLKDQHQRHHLKATQMFINWYEAHSLSQIVGCNELEGSVHLTLNHENGRSDVMKFEDFLSGLRPWSAPEIVHIYDKARTDAGIRTWPSVQSCELWNVALNSKNTEEHRELRAILTQKPVRNEPNLDSEIDEN